MKLTSHWPKRHARVVLAAVACAAALAAGTVIVMHLRGAPPACQLLTAQDVQAATGVTVVETGTTDQSHCRYEGGDSNGGTGKYVIVNISVDQECSDFSEHHVLGVPPWTGLGIGDRAAYQYTTFPWLQVSSHGHCFIVGANSGGFGPNGELEASLARLAASRI